MGDSKVTIQNLRVVKTDPLKGIIMIKGAVPGAKGGWVTLKDAVKKKIPDSVQFPTSSIETREVKAAEEILNKESKNLIETDLNKSKTEKDVSLDSSKTNVSTQKDKDLEQDDES